MMQDGLYHGASTDNPQDSAAGTALIHYLELNHWSSFMVPNIWSAWKEILWLVVSRPLWCGLVRVHTCWLLESFMSS